MNLNDLLIAKGITASEPKQVLVMRHRPTEPQLRKVLPWLAAERPEVFNAYQQTQREQAEKAMMQAKYLASFIEHGAGKALFVGAYKIGKARSLSFDDYWKISANLELKQHGMTGFVSGERVTCLLFDLELTDIYADWKGKLVVDWPEGRAWWRWANRNEFPVAAILEESTLIGEMPDWRKLVLTWQELKALPQKFRAKLSEWRAIYFVLDASDGKGYVGAAYGPENLHQRWLSYAGTGHGGNKKLRDRQPEHFVFSVLERVSPDMSADEVGQLERAWKERLHTREFGLNDN